jgi:hypothetical protein
MLQIRKLYPSRALTSQHSVVGQGCHRAIPESFTVVANKAFPKNRCQLIIGTVTVEKSIYEQGNWLLSVSGVFRRDHHHVNPPKSSNITFFALTSHTTQ